MKKDLEIWVFGDHRNYPHDRLVLQVLGQARSLSKDRGRVTVVLLGHKVERIAKRLGVGLCADCISLDWDEQKEKLIASSPAFGGNFLARIVWSTHRPYMATVSSGTFPERPYEEAACGEIVRVENNLDGTLSKISVISSLHESHPTAKLDDAKIVVAGGRGVKNLEGLNTIRELALLLGGEGGATRPAVEAQWTSHAQLIGQTGKSIKPELLITCGTSGAVQYTAAIGNQRSEEHTSELQS